MKKLLLGLTLLASMSSFSADRVLVCTVNVKMQTSTCDSGVEYFNVTQGNNEYIAASILTEMKERSKYFKVLSSHSTADGNLIYTIQQ